MSSTPLTVGAAVIVYDRYRFAIPLPAVISDFSDTNDGVKIVLSKSNNASYPVGVEIWVHAAQLRPVTEKDMSLPTDSKARKDLPVMTGVVDYFPDALLAVAQVSVYGNDKHNPGQPLHWSKEKSTDHADCALRHLMERGQMDYSYGPDKPVRHSAAAAWRALANLQMEIENERDTQKAEPVDARQTEIHLHTGAFYGPWIAHSGIQPPCDSDIKVEVELRDETRMRGEARAFRWDMRHDAPENRIVAYRIRMAESC